MSRRYGLNVFVVVMTGEVKLKRRKKGVSDLEFFDMAKTLEETALSLIDCVDRPSEKNFARILEIVMEENDCEASRVFLNDRGEYWRRREDGRIKFLESRPI